MYRIRFWADEQRKKLVVRDLNTQQQVEIKKKRQIDQFLFLYGMEFDEVNDVIEANDHLHLFQTTKK